MAESSKPDADKNVQTQVTELKDLLVRYAKQETLDPLKGVLRFLAWGVAGSVLLALGALLLGLGLLRVLEQETAPHLAGHWSWVPYGAVVLYAGLVIGLCGRAIGSEKRRNERERRSLAKGRG